MDPNEWRKRRRDPLFAVEEEAVRPERRLPILLGRFEPVLPVKREVEVADSPLLRLPAPVEVHVAGHVLDPAIYEGQDVIDTDVTQLFQAGAGDPLQVRFQPLALSLDCHGDFRVH